MHIHGTPMNSNVVNPYLAAAEKAMSAQRAADRRKKRRKSAADAEGVSSPEEAFMVGQWMDARRNQALSEEGYKTAVAGKDPDLG
jgi:hypothetical protein